MDAGVDTHRDTRGGGAEHLGQPIKVCQLPNTRVGFNKLARLLAKHELDLVGIEGSRNYGLLGVSLAVCDTAHRSHVPDWRLARRNKRKVDMRRLGLVVEDPLSCYT